MRDNRTTGLSRELFTILVDELEAVVVWKKLTGRRKGLTLEDAVLATLAYFKNNMTQEVIAELLRVSQPTVSRAIAALEGPIERVLADYVPDLAEATKGLVAVIDGTLTPSWSWRSAPELYSGKHHTTGHNHQVVASIDGELLYVSEPLPGSTHDAKALRESRILDFVDPANTIADKGYLGTGVHTPLRKPPKGELALSEKLYNRSVGQIRFVVEQAIAHLKTWRALHTDYRRPLGTYKQAFRTIRALYFYSQSSE